MLLLPVFAVVAEVVFKVRIDPDAGPYLFLAGYVGGSLGLGLLEAEMAGQSAEIVPPSAISTHSADALPPSVPSAAKRAEPLRSASRYDGPIEIEIFSRLDWWLRDGAETTRVAAERCAPFVGPRPRAKAA